MRNYGYGGCRSLEGSSRRPGWPLGKRYGAADVKSFGRDTKLCEVIWKLLRKDHLPRDRKIYERRRWCAARRSAFPVGPRALKRTFCRRIAMTPLHREPRHRRISARCRNDQRHAKELGGNAASGGTPVVASVALLCSLIRQEALLGIWRRVGLSAEEKIGRQLITGRVT